MVWWCRCGWDQSFSNVWPTFVTCSESVCLANNSCQAQIRSVVSESMSPRIFWIVTTSIVSTSICTSIHRAHLRGPRKGSGSELPPALHRDEPLPTRPLLMSGASAAIFYPVTPVTLASAQQDLSLCPAHSDNFRCRAGFCRAEAVAVSRAQSVSPPPVTRGAGVTPDFRPTGRHKPAHTRAG